MALMEEWHGLKAGVANVGWCFTFGIRTAKTGRLLSYSVVLSYAGYWIYKVFEFNKQSKVFKIMDETRKGVY